MFQLTNGDGESQVMVEDSDPRGRGATSGLEGAGWGVEKFTKHIITGKFPPVNDIDFLPELCYIVPELD